MDVERIFASLREWARGLTPEQAALLARLMDAKNSKSFAGITPADVLELRQQMLRSDEETGRVDELKRATAHIEPVASNICFI